jgi:hypothetical protein
MARREGGRETVRQAGRRGERRRGRGREGKGGEEGEGKGRYLVMRDTRGQKIGGNHFCALVDQLEKRVLGVGPWFSPNNWPSAVGDLLAIPPDPFAVGLHIA